jgi:hypothetical protein
VKELIARCACLDSESLAPVIRAGRKGDLVWGASRHVPGRTAAEWLVRRGRFPPPVVLEIARQMARGLERLEASGLCHGDINARGVVLSEGGDLVLPQPGLRLIAHPKEGASHAPLLPEAYDGVAPERITEGTPAGIAGDVYGCASLWWHLLTGRTPVPGGTGVAKLHAVATARIPDVGDLAPDTPGPLAEAIAAGLARKPGARPGSMAELATMLRPGPRVGRRALNRHLSGSARCAAGRRSRPPAVRNPKTAPVWLVAVAGCLLGAMAVSWAGWLAGPSTASATISGAAPEPVAGPAAPDVEPIPPGATPDLVSGPERELPPHEGIDELVLSADGPVELESQELRPGVWVHGEPGRRPVVLVPPTGLAVEPEGVRFENVDFVWDHSGDAVPRREGDAAIVAVSASRAEFRGCTFQAAETATRLPAAIRWTYPPRPSQAQSSLLSGQLRLSDCLLDRVGPAVSCRTAGTPVLKMANVLHLGTGPLVQLDHCPSADEPVLVGLSNVTLREAGPLLECCYGRIPDEPGGICVSAEGCVLATRPETPLLRFVGPDRPERLLNTIRFSGQGSLVLPEAIIAAWQVPGGRVQILDDAVASIAGLVRSGVQFAGGLEAGPAACRIVRWQAPLRSPNPPGIQAGVPQ